MVIADFSAGGLAHVLHREGVEPVDICGRFLVKESLDSALVYKIVNTVPTK